MCRLNEAQSNSLYRFFKTILMLKLFFGGKALGASYSFGII